MLAAWSWLIAPDWDRVREILSPQRRRRSALRAIAQVGIPAVVVLVALVFLVSSLGETFRDSEETATRFFVAAVGCLAAAVVFRLVGYARTAFRAVVALATLLLLARLGMDMVSSATSSGSRTWSRARLR